MPSRHLFNVKMFPGCILLPWTCSFFHTDSLCSVQTPSFNDVPHKLSWIRFLSFSVAVLFRPSFLCLSVAFHLSAFSAFCLPCSHSLSLFLSISLSSTLFYSSSPPSPSVPFHLSLSFLLRSLCLLKVSNKQTSSGWLASPIYNSSQSNYSEDVCQTHEVHLSASQRRREREEEYVLPSWLGLDTQREYPSIELKD